MILVSVGSQKFQFDRLLRQVDLLVESKKIDEEVFAQIGASTYCPKNYAWERYMDGAKFAEKMAQCDILISHGGTGTIIKAVKQGKCVIAVPRLEKYGEHVDDHQLQLVEEFEKLNMVQACYDTEHLDKAIWQAKGRSFAVYESNTENIISLIQERIANW